MEKKEEQIFEQLQLFRALLDNISDPVYFKDTSGMYIGYNKAFQDYFSLNHDSYVGKTVFDLPISRKEAMLHHKADVELIQLPGTKIYETSVTFSDSSIRYIISKKSTFRKADGAIGGIVGVITDITRLKRAEEALEENLARFKDLSGTSFEAVVFIENGVIVDVNKRFYEMFGYSDNEIIGKKASDLIAPEARTLFNEIAVSRNGETHKTLGLKSEGVVFPIEIKQHELQWGENNVRISIIRDLSEQKNMEDEITKSKNLQPVGILAAGIAHDFNNLLMAIVGNISLAKMSISQNEKTTEFLNEAERIVFMGKNLTQQLLTFSHSGDLVRKVVFMGRVLRDVTDKILEGSSVRPRYIIPMDLLPVEVDEDQIRQVIRNMVINAKEAMPSGGAIVISCENVSITPQDRLPLIKEDHIRISIHDEGIGIPEENISKVFDPYFTTKGMSSQKGVGLGLAICYSIVRKHNGYILIDSVPGKGSTFQIYLPATKKNIIEVCIEEEGTRHGKGRVLIMDDEEMILKIAKELLQLMDYEVATTQNGEDTIKLYRQAMEFKRPFDAVILDLAIPDGIGGKEVLRELMAIDPHVKGIISSGYLNDPVMKNFKEYGFIDMLTKPYKTNELDTKLRATIKNRQ